MKFFNKKVTIGGIKFDSKKEGERWLVLLDMQKKGVISDLQRQVEWEIIPKLTYMKTVQLKTKTTASSRFVTCCLSCRATIWKMRQS